MKNLKKILSLVLALAMALSLMTVAFAKDTGDFADGDDVTYAEAVDVMATIGVFNGVGDGSNFDPKGTLTREQAAKIITYMIMGQAQADKLVATIAPFADVSADRWSAGAIAYCASEGIMNGTGNGKFNPTGELTGLQFAKMLLVALGYDAEIEDMTGAAWGLATSKLAYAVELDDGMDDINLTDVMTREQAAQMALTTMKTPLVEYPDKGATIKVNGAVVEFGAQKAQYVTSEIAREQTISSQQLTNGNGYTVEFAEKYCQKLVLNGNTNAFGAPAYTWSYDKQEINTYEDDSDLVAEFTTKVTGKDMYNAITKNVYDNMRNFEVKIDGEDNAKINTNIFGVGDVSRNNTDAIGATEKGVLTQVFVTNVDYQGTTLYDVTIVIKNTYLAIASEDYDSKNEEVDLDVYALNAASNDKKDAHNYIKDRDNEKKAVTVKAEDIDVTEVKEDEIYLVTVADGKVQEMIVPEVVSDASIDSFRKGKDVSVDGTTYEYAHTAKYDVDVLNAYDNNNLKDVTYNVILDPYGYLIGIEQNEDPDQFVFVTGMDGNNSNLSTKNADANAIFLDGTMKTITVNTGKSTMGTPSGNDASQINKWYTYGVDSNGVYTLKEIKNTLTYTDENGNSVTKKYAQYSADGANIKIDKKNVTLPSNGTTGKVYGNDDSIYINVKTKAIDVGNTTPWRMIVDDVDSITVGVKNASLVLSDQTTTGDGTNKDNTTAGASKGPKTFGDEVYTLFNDKGYVIAAVTVGEDDGVSKNYVYVTSSDVKRESYDKATDKWTWTREAIVNGELVDLKEVGSSKDLSYLSPNSSEADKLVQGRWFEIKFDADGNVKSAENLTSALDATATDGYVNNVSLVQPAVTAKDNAILWQTSFSNSPSATSKNITYKNGTLYVATDGVKGFSVSPEVKVVLCLSNGKTGDKHANFDDVDDSYKGYTGLENAIRNLDSNFTGDLSAVFENGVATVIIFNDTTAGTTTTPGGNDDDGTGLGITPGSGKLIYKYYDSEFAAADWADIRVDAANAAAEYYGTTVTKNNISVTAPANGSQAGYTVMLDDGSLKGESITVDIVRMVKITKDDEFVAYTPADGATNTTAALGSGNYIKGATNVKVGNGTQVTGNQTVQAAATATDADVAFTTAYKVTFTSLSTGSNVRLKGVDGAPGVLTDEDWVKKDTVLVVTGTTTGDDLIHQLVATVGDEDSNVGAAKKVATSGGSPATDAAKGEYTVSDGNVTLTEKVGYTVKVPGKTEVLGNGEKITFTGPNETAVYAAKKDVTNGDYGTTPITGTVKNIGTQYEYTVNTSDAGTGANAGTIELVQVAKVTIDTMVPSVKEYRLSSVADGAAKTGDITSGRYYEIGVKLSLAGVVPADADAAGKNIQVKQPTTGTYADVDGSTTSAYDGTSGTASTAKYTIQSTDYDLFFNEA